MLTYILFITIIYYMFHVKHIIKNVNYIIIKITIYLKNNVSRETLNVTF